MLKFLEFAQQIKEFYEENEIYVDTQKLNFINTELKYAVSSMNYLFNPGIGRYKDRTLEISPSKDHPYIISLTERQADKNEKILDDSNPSTRFQSCKTVKADYEYLVMKLSLKKDIGKTSILIYPKGKIKRKLFYKDEEDLSNAVLEEYKIKIEESQKWFYNCLDEDIKRMIKNIQLPDNKGAVFQFSLNAATFSIVPRAIGKVELKQALNIIEKIACNIDQFYIS